MDILETLQKDFSCFTHLYKIMSVTRDTERQEQHTKDPYILYIYITYPSVKNKRTKEKKLELVVLSQKLK